jgi:predicted  nucleic acid-binding Zn-ribbon protein
MSERRAPDLSTKNSGDGYRRSGGARRADPKSGTGGVGKQIGMNLMMAVLIGGLVLAGWFIANQQQMLKEEQAKVADADARLLRLESRLSATDSALSQEGDATKEQINLWESEIRKLWAVSNERNKKWIEDNQKAVKTLTGSINGIESTSRDLKAAVGRHETAFAQQQTMIDNLASLELQIQQIARGQRDLVDKVNAANQAVASLRAGIAAKVDDNAEAIASMDAYRVAVNSRLADIDRRLGGPGGQ